jgi:hypothetical protein
MIKKNYLTLVFSILLFNMNAQELEQHQWKNRILIIKTNQDSNNVFYKQLAEVLSDKKGIIERKLIIYTANDAILKMLDFSKNKEVEISNTKDGILKPKENFEILLIGLDGGIKLKQDEFLALENLFSLIDGMPMRRQELKRN